MNRSFLIGVSMIACVMASAARAQTAPPSSDPALSPRTTSDQGAQSSSDGLADIIVTATKVETSLQRTPQVITAIDGATLSRAGVSDVQQLNKLVSGLQIEANGSASSIYIRGVGSRVLTPIADPAIAFGVDGVYFARPLGTSLTLFDLSRIEVVKGPQGTLYGRNATGGAVNVITNQPKLGVRSLDGEFEVGNYQAVRAMAAVNLPLGERAALRIAGQTVYRNGYLSDGYDDANSKAVRASLLFEPSSTFRLYLSGDYAHQGGMGPGSIPVGPGSNNNVLTTRFVVPDQPYTGPSDPRINAFLHASAPATRLNVPFPGFYCVGAPLNGVVAPGSPAVVFCQNPLGVADQSSTNYLNNDFYGFNVTADADLGIGILTAIGSYRNTKIDTVFSLDSHTQTALQRINQFSGELRLTSEPGNGALKWLVGAYYLREKQNVSSSNDVNNIGASNPIPAPGSPLPATTCLVPLDPDGPGPLPPVPGLCVANSLLQQAFAFSNPYLVNETYAVFGQATYSVTAGVRITGGIRYTHETKTELNGVVSSIYSLPSVTVTYPSAASVKFNDVSYRAGLEIDLAPRSLLYATFSTAFHAGGFNYGVRQGPNQFEYAPEEVRSYVVGVKNRFLGNRLQINLEAFWLDYDNYQQNNFGRANDGSAACSTLNIVAACPLTLRTENAATARIRGVEGDVVFAPMRDTTLSLNVLYNDAKFVRFVLPDVITGGATVYDGRRVPGSVPVTITGGITQGFPLSGGGRVVADARSQYKSGAYLWFTNTPAVYQKGYTRTDLSLTYEAPSNRFSITAFVRNVENNASLLQGGPLDFATGATWLNLNPPRTYGASVGFHF